MLLELFPFQKLALSDMRMKTAEAMSSYQRTHTPQVVSFTAPTGAGKTIIMATLIENILFGNETYPEQPDAVIVWLSDSPQLNEQSKLKIDAKSEKIRLQQCVTVSDSSFDMEQFEDGHIYFLNTQKLSATSNLTKSGDSRTYSIWETIANTAREKSERLYFIIDEAHRGMQGREAGKATTIMQKFLKGSPENGISPMPLVIGMSATPERFNKLVAGTTSTIYKSVVTAESVRNSGLLKDRIVITYPEENAVNKDMAILQAAADDWKEKWEHWSQYCQEQHYAYVNPIFVIQVLNGSNNQLSDTNLDDCLQKIEERTGFRFEKGQVVHTFGQTDSSVLIHGLEVPYKEPSGIADDRNIRIVFFKENLSTGWDCPRAETMMSFRHATDSTYIAQLLGRMVRTPMQMHIQVDDVLNDVHLYLPYFDADTVKEVVDALQSAEGGEIPTEVYGESLGRKTFETLTVKSGKKKEKPKESVDFGQMSFDGDVYSPVNVAAQALTSGNSTHEEPKFETSAESSPVSAVSESAESVSHAEDSFIKSESSETKEKITKFPVSSDKDSLTTEEDLFDREAVMKFINDAGLLTYHVRNVRISNYLASLFKMVHLLTLSGLYPNAVNEVKEEIVQMIHEYIDNLKSNSKYDELVKQVKQFRLSTQIFDVFGEYVDEYTVHDCFTTTDTDVDRQLRLAENKLANEGISSAYGNTVKMPWHDQNIYKIDVILFTSDEESMKQLNTYAETKLHNTVLHRGRFHTEVFGIIGKTRYYKCFKERNFHSTFKTKPSSRNRTPGNSCNR